MQALNDKRIISLDGLRGIFIILITLGHTCSIGNIGFGLIGNIGFFMLSGFFMYNDGTLLSIQSGNIKLSTFIYKRLYKIYPTYLITFVIQLLMDGVRNLAEILANVFLVHSGWFWDSVTYNGPSWFLSTLLLVYIIYYYIVRFVKKENLIYIIGVIAIAAWTLSTYYFDIPFLYNRTMIGICSFMIGCLLRKVSSSSIATRFHRTLNCLISMMLLVIVLGWIAFGVQKALGDKEMIFVYILLPGIIWLSISSRAVKWILSLPMFSFLGEISMQIFLWHMIIANLLKKTFMRSWDWEALDVKAEIIYIVIVVIWCFLCNAVMKKIKWEKLLNLLK